MVDDERDEFLGMASTKDQQVKTVVIGTALGVLAQGVDAVPSGKMSLEFAFNHAWWEWPQARHFEKIGGPSRGTRRHDPGNLFWIGLRKSEARMGACAAWESGTWCVPYITDEGWSVEEALDHHADADVTAQDWVGLGRLFVEYFKPEEVQRSA